MIAITLWINGTLMTQIMQIVRRFWIGVY